MEWISVKDRLPEMDKFTLAKTTDRREEWQYIVLRLLDTEGCGMDNIIKFWAAQSDANIELEFEEITHWMPLPEAPKTN